MTKLAVILTQGFADWEYALIAGTGGPYFGMQVEFFTPEPGEITSFGGLTSLVSQSLSEIKQFAPTVIVVVGGSIWDTEQAPDIAELLKMHHENGVAIAGICGATLALAKAGLLNDVAHTSNSAMYVPQHVKSYSGQSLYRDVASAVSDNRVISASGTAPVSFAAAVFEAAGLAPDALQQFRAMMAAEHMEPVAEAVAS